MLERSIMRKLVASLSFFSVPVVLVTACGGSHSDDDDPYRRDAAQQEAGTSNRDASAVSTDGTSFGDANAIACDVGPLGKGDRVVVVKNLCVGQTVTVGVNGGYVTDCGPNRECPTGSTCSDARSPAGCFWDFPKPTCGSGALKSGESATYVLTAPPRPVGPAGSQVTVKWSGNVYASTDCDANGENCKTAQCARSVDGKTIVGRCATGTGPQGPATLAEFTFVPEGRDYYDISAINGVNVPVSMGPISGTTDPADPYFCMTGGGVTPSVTGLSGCDWEFDPTIALAGGASDQRTLLRAVTSGGAACTSDAQCAGGELCGTAVTFGTTTVTKSCGKPIGWWTGNEICVYSNNDYGAPLDCAGAVPGQGKRADLFECAGANPNSCYSNVNANATCCGCPDWTIDGKKLPLTPGFQCYGTNPQWTSVAEPWAAFTKKACPTAYSFPFDDPTSTFTCTTPNPSAATPNATHYEIVFCPGGKDAR